MKIAIVADNIETAEMLANISNIGNTCFCVGDLADLSSTEIDVVVDLSFRLNGERIDVLRNYLPRPVFINSVCHTLAEVCTDFIRINAWPGFLNRPTFEIAIGDPSKHAIVNLVCEKLGWKYVLVKDIPGMIGARILAMIVNEAYFALDAGVSSIASIDLAMKLGTNYPYGPFEWAQKIGLRRIADLLNKLQETDPMVYAIAPALLEELARSSDGRFLQGD